MDRKFELLVLGYPTGTLYCNKAVLDGSSYRHLAFVGREGKITWYAGGVNVPWQTRERIEQEAKEKRRRFEKKLHDAMYKDDAWYSMFRELADRMDMESVRHLCSLETRRQQAEYITHVIYSTAVWV